MHTFAYVRVSTAGQTTDNQVLEIEQAGYEADAIYSDVVSGKVPAMKRPEFARLMDAIRRTRKPKRLIVTKLDRLGRDASDIMATVKTLSRAGCAVQVLHLGALDVASSAGNLVMVVLAGVAEMERDILKERTNAGLARARSEGKKLGRPKAADEVKAAAIRDKLKQDIPVAQIARDCGVSRATVARIRDGQWTA
ncbi:MAG: recombinase family protein [Alphaproteobacteria bacterium]|nr:recombinase family protein [Alphaproteobacteria bacterium]